LLPVRPAHVRRGPAGVGQGAADARRSARRHGGQPVPLRHLQPSSRRGPGRAKGHHPGGIMTLQSISRRAFLVGSGTTVVGVMVGGLGMNNLALAAEEAASASGQAGFSPVAWVSIAADNTAVIYSPGAEMGQGTKTAIPCIFAEDMELDWSLV